MPEHHALVSFCERRQLAFVAVDERSGTVHRTTATGVGGTTSAAAGAAEHNEPTTLSTFGAPGHDIVAAIHDSYRDAVRARKKMCPPVCVRVSDHISHTYRHRGLHAFWC